MEHPNADLIHLIAAPCFCVREAVIVSRNAAAESLPLSVGDAVTPLLLTGAEEYAAFQNTDHVYFFSFVVFVDHICNFLDTGIYLFFTE